MHSDLQGEPADPPAQRGAAADLDNAVLQSLRADFNDLRSESLEAGAMALALGGLHIPDGRDNALTMRFGSFEGGSAFATQGAFRISGKPDITVQFGTAVGMQYNQTGVVAGFTLSW